MRLPLLAVCLIFIFSSQFAAATDIINDRGLVVHPNGTYEVSADSSWHGGLNNAGLSPTANNPLELKFASKDGFEDIFIGIKGASVISDTKMTHSMVGSSAVGNLVLTSAAGFADCKGTVGLESDCAFVTARDCAAVRKSLDGLAKQMGGQKAADACVGAMRDLEISIDKGRFGSTNQRPASVEGVVKRAFKTAKIRSVALPLDSWRKLADLESSCANISKYQGADAAAVRAAAPRGTAR